MWQRSNALKLVFGTPCAKGSLGRVGISPSSQSGASGCPFQDWVFLNPFLEQAWMQRETGSHDNLPGVLV